eukprot:gnl/TRDRNA2_/TRDRNA2_171640_c5_seq6.p1 gnl/TRDRNA2_/TRDRNA2_171640_c5~~gnl/TRDRNA2_/TRDRNA2_171640_c5_seq6.p1  ORF type:complete len:199 (-),score=15.32 gnl/TRDRNA2_/TRDRNA2_171640_c5_seq6:855-1451(-)
MAECDPASGYVDAVQMAVASHIQAEQRLNRGRFLDFAIEHCWVRLKLQWSKCRPHLNGCGTNIMTIIEQLLGEPRNVVFVADMQPRLEASTVGSREQSAQRHWTSQKAIFAADGLPQDLRKILPSQMPVRFMTFISDCCARREEGLEEFPIHVAHSCKGPCQVGKILCIEVAYSPLDRSSQCCEQLRLRVVHRPKCPC